MTPARHLGVADPTSLLPPNATRFERDLEILSRRLDVIPTPLRDLVNVETIPERFMPWLAFTRSVDSWNPGWSPRVKRNLIASSIDLHRRKGSAGSANAEGAPITVAPPAPSTDQLAIEARRRRDAEIASVRWLVERHRDEQALQIATTLTPEDYRLVQEHVQALRDVPEQDGFPHTIDWPVLAPELLATGE